MLEIGELDFGFNIVREREMRSLLIANSNLGQAVLLNTIWAHIDWFNPVSVKM